MSKAFIEIIGPEARHNLSGNLGLIIFINLKRNVVPIETFNSSLGVSISIKSSLGSVQVKLIFAYWEF